MWRICPLEKNLFIKRTFTIYKKRRKRVTFAKISVQGECTYSNPVREWSGQNND